MISTVQTFCSTRRTRSTVSAVALVALLGVVGACGDDAPDVQAGTTTTAASTPTTATTQPPETTAPTTVAPLASDDAAFALWPDPAGEVRFEDPLDAARSFATELVGFTDPVLGEFQEGDSRSGEVEVRPSADGPVSLVLVRQLGTDGSWWVLSALNEDIVIDDPQPYGAIDHPLQLSGSARAFEGTVQVAVYLDGVDEPLGEGFVTGSGGPDLGPFEGEVAFEAPQGGFGAVVLYTTSAEDGSVLAVSAVRVGFIGGD